MVLLVHGWAGRGSQVASLAGPLVEAGYQEAVISGVHLGSYGHDLGHPQGLYQLVQAILAETDLPRLRLSSLEPWDLGGDFFELWQIIPFRILQ